MGLFGSGSTLSKQKELEKLINESILTTIKWENAGEPNDGELIIIAASTIRNNFPKIVSLFQELINFHKSRNLYMKNNILPAPFPKELSIPNAIKGIIDYTTTIETKNQSFKGQIISPDTLRTISGMLR